MGESGVTRFPSEKRTLIQKALRENGLSFIVLILLLALGAALGPPVYRLLSRREAVQAWIRQSGPWGPLVSIFLNVLQVLLAPVPGQVIGVANGYLYGVAEGTLYSWIGVQLGSALAMGVARLWGRPFVLRWLEVLGGRERATAWLERWDALARRRGPMIFLAVFLLPFLPDDLACFAIGLSPLPLVPMWVLAGVGRLPGLLVASWVGASATQPPVWLWSVLIAGGFLLGWMYNRWRERVERVLLRVLRA